MKHEFLKVPGVHEKPGCSEVAVVAPGASFVFVGGQNAVNERGEVVGTTVKAQCEQVLKNLNAALKGADCNWSNVVRVTLVLRSDADAKEGMSVFGPALKDLKAPPLTTLTRVASLARPEFLVEVGLDAVR